MVDNTLTLAELRYSLEAAAEYLARLRDRLPSDTPEATVYCAGKAHGLLHRALAALSAKAS